MTQCFYYSLDNFFNLFKLWPERSVGENKVTNLSAMKTREKHVEIYGKIIYINGYNCC